MRYLFKHVRLVLSLSVVRRGHGAYEGKYHRLYRGRRMQPVMNQIDC